MTINFRTIWLFLANHILSWSFVFILFVGFDLRLAPSYFYMGWSFSGGELPSLVWFYSWAIFIFIMLAYFVVQRVVSGLTLRSERRRRIAAPLNNTLGIKVTAHEN